VPADQLLDLRRDDIVAAGAVVEDAELVLLLATAVWNALKDAIAATGDRKTAVRLDAPATPERILAAIAKLKR
jgi:xanthine dehydrogenase molybdopterin-binding subunit B